MMKLRTTGVSISGKGFVETFDIAPAKTTIYSCKQDERGWIVADLSTGKERKRNIADKDDS